jgi:hypothetical protein
MAGMLIAGAAAPAAAADGPVVTSTGFTEGQWVRPGQKVQPTVSADTVKLQLLVNGGVRSTWPWPVVHPTLGVGAAEHDTDIDVTIRAFDADGNTGEATTRVRVDVYKPKPAYTPAQDEAVHGRTTITVTPDVDDYVKVSMHSYDGTELAKVTAAPWVIEHDFTGEDGKVYFVATDVAGNVSQQYLARYRVDERGPDVELFDTFIQPGSAYLQARVFDVSPVERIEWWVEGALRATGTSLTYDFGAAERVNPVEIRAWDKWGNRSVVTIPVRTDSTAPVVSKVTPDYKQLVRGTSVTSTITATDPSGFHYVDLNGEVFGENVAGPTGTFTGSRQLGRDGYLTLYWQVSDRAGNMTRFPRTFIVDNTRPAITKITAPGANAKVGSQVKTSMSATDLNGVKEVQMWVNGKLTLSDSKAPYSMTLNTAKYGKSFTVAFYAVDKAGNVISTTRRTWRR